MKRPNILVVGSLAMDLIVSTKRFPNVGETVIGTAFSTAPGGKGANQAVQAARLGADVTMVGKVGNDDFGTDLIRTTKESGVDVTHITRTDNSPTAVGNVQLQSNENGTDNRIIAVPGANMAIEPCDVEFLENDIKKFDIVILQHEISDEINLIVADYARKADVPVMLNPAPIRSISDELIGCLTYISPNEHEVGGIVGTEPYDEGSAEEALRKLHSKGIPNVLVTLGKRGCAFYDGENITYAGSEDCGKVVDTTAAGDSFVAAFCTAISAGLDVESALVFANCTAGITVTGMGAQPSLPTYDQVISVMKEKAYDIEKYAWKDNQTI